MHAQGTTIPASPSRSTTASALTDLRPHQPVAVPVVPARPPAPRPGEPGLLFFGAHRRSGTTWLSALLNTHPEVHIRNEGWIFNDRGCSFESWFDRERFHAWAAGREARGTWLRDLDPHEAARLMQRAMLRTLLVEAAQRDTWKRFDRLRWIGDKTTQFYTRAIDFLFDVFPPPHARFLSMIRDGRDAVISNLFLIFRENRFDRLPPDASAHAMAAREFHALGRGTPVPLFSAPLLRWLVTDWVDSICGARRAADLYGPSGSFFEIRYESLVADTPTQLEQLFSWLGVSTEPALIEGIIAENRFEKASGGRARGQSEPLAEFRNGLVGDWRNHFTEDDKHLFKAIAGGLLIELGYEQTMAW